MSDTDPRKPPVPQVTVHHHYHEKPGVNVFSGFMFLFELGAAIFFGCVLWAMIFG